MTTTTPRLGLRAAGRRRLDGAVVLVAGEARGVGRDVAAQLAALGAAVAVVGADRVPVPADLEALGRLDALIWLRTLRPDVGVCPRCLDARAALAWWQPAIFGRTTTLLAVTPGGGSVAGDDAGSGLGLADLAESLARQHPDRSVRTLELDPGAESAALASSVVAALLDSAGPPAVGLRRATQPGQVAIGRAWPGPLAFEPRPTVQARR